MKPLCADLPYPSTETLSVDVTSGKILSFAFASATGELSAILQYVYHQLHLSGTNKQCAETLEAIALCEMRHLQILGQAMINLGVNPRYVQHPNSNCFFSASCVSQSVAPQKMIMDDLRSELETIAEYKKMLFVLKNEEVQAIVERIILDEQVHVEALKSVLKEVGGVSG